MQLTDLGQDIGPRLTRSVTRARLSSDLFGAIGTKVSFIENGTVYELATDPAWRRVLFGLSDEWIRGFTGEMTSRPLSRPRGIDISARGIVYIADPDNGRIVIADFNRSSGSLGNAREFSSGLGAPIDAAWDGRSAPLSTDFIYVADDSLDAVSYWDVSSGVPSSPAWTYGSTGSGTGQFLDPSGLCVGKTVSPSGGTQFTTDFYVVDRGNRRVVRLQRGSMGAAWVNSAVLLPWDPVDCAVDHFGNLYVSDEMGHRIHKFTGALVHLESYGQYGQGSTLNTFAFPHAISVPCGLKAINSQIRWYCEGRVLTAEAWSESTGAVEHYLGFAAQQTSAPSTDGNGNTWFGYRVTDHAYHAAKIMDDFTNLRRVIHPSGLVPPGDRNVFWDGLLEDGTEAPSGYYYFRIEIGSAYTCFGEEWCARTLHSERFYHEGPSGGGGGGGGDGDPCIICGAPPLHAPAALFLRQRIVTNPRPLARVSAPTLPGTAGRTTTADGALTPLVREFGVRGLTFSVTAEVSARPVTIRVLSMSGRSVRTLVNERLDPGVYEIGWDGLDDAGRPVAPGVYVALMTSGTFRATQHLILRQPAN